MTKLKPDAPTPRDPQCRVHYVRMFQQRTIHDTWEWVCPFSDCHVRWVIPEQRVVFGEDE
jgi:hypothetical protein